jgi:hypothetical protein
LERRRKPEPEPEPEPGLGTALALLVASTAVAALMVWQWWCTDQPALYHPLEESGRSPHWIKVKNPDAPAATRLIEG